MKQEDKELLLSYLSMALPYKIKVCLYEKETCILLGIDGYEVYLDVDSDSFRIESIKPYLRPMSSMTEDEINEFILISDTVLWLGNKRSTCMLSIEQINWLSAHHFDFLGLIPKGLAIEVTEENNPYK